MKIGLSISDLKEMPLTTVLNLVSAYADMSDTGTQREVGVRDATQDDIDSFLA